MSKVLFFSGAGLSADSGLGVFRGSGGMWDKYDIKQVCYINTWERNYDLVHEFYSKRRIEYAKAEPNLMHKTIADLQNQYGEDRVTVITQNVDNLLEKAGCSKVLHVHGHINYIHCVDCGLEKRIEGEFKGEKCEKCGGVKFKPSIVFFGEQAPNYYPMYMAFDSLTSYDAVAVIGTEGSVVPIGQIIGSRSSGVPAKRFLCNLEKSPYINAADFDKVIYDRAENAADEARSFAEAVLKG